MLTKKRHAQPSPLGGIGGGKARTGGMGSQAKRQVDLRFCAFAVSISINVVLALLIIVSSFSSPPSSTTAAITATPSGGDKTSPEEAKKATVGGDAEDPEGLVCKQSGPGPYLGAPVSASPLSRGLVLGAHWYDLQDIMAFVSVDTHKQAYATFYGWGDILQAYGSYEVYRLGGSSSNSEGEPEVLTAEMRIPLPIPTNRYKVKSRKEVSLYIRELAWPGKTERVPPKAEADKTEALWRWVARQLNGCAGESKAPYCTRKWFVKANQDVFVIPKHLLALLSEYDASEPLCLANTRQRAGTSTGTDEGAGSGRSCPRGAVYVLSAPAVAAVGKAARELAESGGAAGRVPEGEEKRMGVFLEKAGVRVVDVGDTFFDKRMGARNPASQHPLVTLGDVNEKMMRDYRALVNIEFKHSYFAQ